MQITEKKSDLLPEPVETPTEITMVPVQDKIIVEQDPAPIFSKGGLEIPENQRIFPHTGTVIAVGPGYKGEKMVSKVGDRVNFNPLYAEPFEANDKAYLIMRESDLRFYIQ